LHPLAIAQHHFSIFLYFWAGRNSSVLGARAAPGGLETLQKAGGGAKPPTFLKGSQAPRGRPDPQNQRLPAGPKIMKKRKMALSDGKPRPWGPEKLRSKPLFRPRGGSILGALAKDLASRGPRTLRSRGTLPPKKETLYVGRRCKADSGGRQPKIKRMVEVISILTPAAEVLRC
jgi:hypothetical protein